MVVTGGYSVKKGNNTAHFIVEEEQEDRLWWRYLGYNGQEEKWIKTQQKRTKDYIIARRGRKTKTNKNKSYQFINLKNISNRLSYNLDVSSSVLRALILIWRSLITFVVTMIKLCELYKTCIGNRQTSGC